MPPEDAQTIAETFQVSAGLVLSGHFDLSAYPHRHLAVAADRGFWFQRLAQVLAAADMLTPAGFALVNTIEFTDGNAVCAILRRG
ncbi:hypothetical protein AB0M20_12865 [Actinoplanes sp. NPDC051633]|uniref:hypothetical protein n=1 Tax=Actinoplanes sp. NPDC051633 TaxID=3155670 RepID=UPI003428E887